MFVLILQDSYLSIDISLAAYLSEGEPLVDTFAYIITDGSLLTDTGYLTVTIRGENDAPTALTLSNTSVYENQAGAVIGKLEVSDPDHNDTFTFTVDDTRLLSLRFVFLIYKLVNFFNV